MREIGGEFWDIPICNQENIVFPEYTQWFLSGRSALQAIIKELTFAKTVAMPSWCCDSMIKPFVDAGMTVRFYPVYLQESFIQEIQMDSDILFVMDYFGYTSDNVIKHPCIIRDATHSMFSHSYSDAHYSFGSLRKWCGILTGGYAWTGDGHSLFIEKNAAQDYITLRQKAMANKKQFINECNVYRGAYKSYLTIYDEAEKILENCTVAPAADSDIELAKKLDVNYIKQRRMANSKILMDAFPDQLVFRTLKNADCPMFVPIITKERNMLQRYLCEHEIYCPIHWPKSKYHKLDNITEKLYKEELSLVCDQRYTETDMHRIVEEIKRFWTKG